jgi:hypothetical protein
MVMATPQFCHAIYFDQGRVRGAILLLLIKINQAVYLLTTKRNNAHRIYTM